MELHGHLTASATEFLLQLACEVEAEGIQNQDCSRPAITRWPERPLWWEPGHFEPLSGGERLGKALIRLFQIAAMQLPHCVGHFIQAQVPLEAGAIPLVGAIDLPPA